MAILYPSKPLKTDISPKGCSAIFKSNKIAQLNQYKGKGGAELKWISADRPSGIQVSLKEVFKSPKKCFLLLSEGRASLLNVTDSGTKSVFIEPLKQPPPPPHIAWNKICTVKSELHQFCSPTSGFTGS